MLEFNLPAAQSVFIPQARRRCLHRSVIVCAAIFGEEKDVGLQDTSLSVCLCGEGEDGCEESTSELHTNLEG